MRRSHRSRRSITDGYLFPFFLGWFSRSGAVVSGFWGATFVNGTFVNSTFVSNNFICSNFVNSSSRSVIGSSFFNWSGSVITPVRVGRIDIFRLGWFVIAPIRFSRVIIAPVGFGWVVTPVRFCGVIPPVRVSGVRSRSRGLLGLVLLKWGVGVGELGLKGMVPEEEGSVWGNFRGQRGDVYGRW